MKILRELGLRKLVRFFFFVPLMGFFNVLGYPNLRVFFLRIFGCKIGKNVVIHKIKMFNLYAGKLVSFSTGDNVFIGDDCLLDMANKIKIGKNVTLAERVVVLTHTNVGYHDHPLQKYFPRFSAPVEFKDGCFVGANSTVLPGVIIGKKSFIAAGSVVNRSVPPKTLVAGVPAKVIRKII